VRQVFVQHTWSSYWQLLGALRNVIVFNSAHLLVNTRTLNCFSYVLAMQTTYEPSWPVYVPYVAQSLLSRKQPEAFATILFITLRNHGSLCVQARTLEPTNMLTSTVSYGANTTVHLDAEACGAVRKITPPGCVTRISVCVYSTKGSSVASNTDSVSEV
jgi:hypothetical protein